MKKTVILLFAAVALLSSCAKSDKCKCTFEVGPLTLQDQIISNNSDKACSQISTSDIEAGDVKFDLSEIGTIKCVNYNE